MKMRHIFDYLSQFSLSMWGNLNNRAIFEQKYKFCRVKKSRKLPMSGEIYRNKAQKLKSNEACLSAVLGLRIIFQNKACPRAVLGLRIMFSQ